MNTNRIVPIFCALVASTIAACSGDSQPIGPETGSGSFNRVAPTLVNSDGSGSTGRTGTDVSKDPSRTPSDPSGGGSLPAPRSIDEFLRAQGTFCVDDGMGGCRYYGAPVENYLTWFDPNRNLTMAIDYAGIVSRWAQRSGLSISSRYDGSVSEQPLGDGTSRVTVELKGSDVSSYAVSGANLSDPVFFGVSPGQMSDPRFAPALGELRMTISFIQATGAPFSDLIGMIRRPNGAQRLLSISLEYTGVGTIGDQAMYYQGGGAEDDPALRPEQRRGSMTMRFDSQQGAIMWDNPYAQGNSAPTGYADMQMTTF